MALRFNWAAICASWSESSWWRAVVFEWGLREVAVVVVVVVAVVVLVVDRRMVEGMRVVGGEKEVVVGQDGVSEGSALSAGRRSFAEESGASFWLVVEWSVFCDHGGVEGVGTSKKIGN